MSKISRAVVTCTNCKNTYDINAYTSVNVTLDQELKSKVISGDIFNSECDHCGFTNRTDYDILYHDMKGKFMVWLTLPDHENNIFFQKSSLKLTKNALGTDYTFRISRYPHHLIEKIRVLECGIDDRLIELYKFLFKIESNYPVETENDFLHFESLSKRLLNGTIFNWQLINQVGEIEAISHSLNRGNFAFAEKLITTLEPVLKNEWYMVDWQFPFGQIIEDDTLVKLPVKSEMTEIETDKTLRQLPMQFIEVLERTGKGRQL
jgi:hypothetical protein